MSEADALGVAALLRAPTHKVHAAPHVRRRARRANVRGRALLDLALNLVQLVSQLVRVMSDMVAEGAHGAGLVALFLVE